MDGMSFDYDHYYSEETFVVDDFGEFCEDIVRIACASSQYLCKEFDNELHHDGSPPGTFIASNRCFEKEVPSLFSEMEYLTEVSPETDMVLSDQKSVTIAVNPSELSCKRPDNTALETYKEGFVEASPFRRPDSVIESTPIAGKQPEESVLDTHISDNLTAPTDYQRILNNYIQKGRRKLEASSYLKVESLAKKKINVHSTSLVETVTISSLLCQGQRTIESTSSVGKHPEESVLDRADNPTGQTDYQRILNNYIQKGRRKLKASSYSKVKGLAKEKLIDQSTSLVETVTISPLIGQHTMSTQSSVNYTKVPTGGNLGTATVNRLPTSTADETIVVISPTAGNTRVKETSAYSKLPPCPTLRHSMFNRTTAGSTRAYRCPDCNFSFPSSEMLRKHACIIAEQYQCHLCLREFKKRKTLDHHMKSHDKVFSTDNDLRK